MAQSSFPRLQRPEVFPEWVWGRLAAVMACVWLGGMIQAGDWPQLRGPARDGASDERLPGTFPKDGPGIAWKARVGSGYGGPVVAQGQVFIHHRRDDQEVLEAFAAEDGRERWRAASPATYVDDFGFDNGPRATPAVAGDRLFALGADGRLRAVRLADGHLLWEIEARREFGASKGYFGFACSPLVEGGRVLVNLGGRDGAGIVAFDADTGRVAWKATDHEASYSSPVALTVAGARRVLFFTRNGLVGLDPAVGRVTFEHPWRARIQASVNAAMPLVVGDTVFLTASYDTGGIALRVEPDRVSPVWSNDSSLSSQFASPVFFEGHLYGFHGRLDGGRPVLRCVELASGKVRWTEEGLGAGSVLRIGADLLVLLETGEILVAQPSPEGFRTRARFQGLGREARAHPAFAQGRLYARDAKQLVCLELAPAKPRP